MLVIQHFTQSSCNNLVPPSIHMTTIDVDIVFHIKRIGEIMNPIKVFSLLEFPGQGDRRHAN